MSGPGKYDLDLYRGDSRSWRFKLWVDKEKTQPVDLAGATPKAEFRDAPGGLVIITFECAIEEPNIVAMELTAEMWEDVAPANGAWDLEITFPDGKVNTPLYGDVEVTPDVTNSVLPTVELNVMGLSAAPVVNKKAVDLRSA